MMTPETGQKLSAMAWLVVGAFSCGFGVYIAVTESPWAGSLLVSAGVFNAGVSILTRT